MKTKEDIQDRIKWIENAIDDKDCQIEAIQIRLYAQLSILEWVLEDKKC